MDVKTLNRHAHLDEIAGLLASGYVRLRQKRAGRHTSGPHSPDGRDMSLDSIRQAERCIGTEPISTTGGCQWP